MCDIFTQGTHIGCIPWNRLKVTSGILHTTYIYFHFLSHIMATIPSKEQCQKDGTYAPLPSDNYIAKIVKVEENVVCQSYDSSLKRGYVQDVSELPEDETNIQTKVELLIYGLKSGDDMIDNNKEAVEPLLRRAWKQFNVKSIGFNKEGEPSHRRAFLAFASQQDVEGEFEADDKALEGNYVGVDLALNQKGTGNKVVRFTKVPASFSPDKKMEKEAMAVYEEKEKEKKSVDPVKEAFDSL